LSVGTKLDFARKYAIIQRPSNCQAMREARTTISSLLELNTSPLRDIASVGAGSVFALYSKLFSHTLTTRKLYICTIVSDVMNAELFVL
jgi:hypothetical protein